MRTLRDHLLAVFVLLHVLYVGISPFPAADPEVRIGAAWNSVRTAVRSRGDNYRRYLGTRQSWAMFKGSVKSNGQMQIAVHNGEKWHTVYVERSRSREWRKPSFDHYRWREMFAHFARKKKRRQWHNMGKWVSGLLFEQYPEVQRVRLRIKGGKTPTAEVLSQTHRIDFKKTIWTQTFERPAP